MASASVSDLDLACSAAPGVQDAVSPSASTATPAVPAAEILEMDPQLPTQSSIPAISAVPAISSSLSAVQIVEKNYENTLATVLEEYAAVSESLHKAQVEIESLRTKLFISERKTEDAQTAANEIWQKYIKTKDLPKVVDMLERQVESLIVTAALNEDDACKHKERLKVATDHITYLESQLEKVSSTRRAGW